LQPIGRTRRKLWEWPLFYVSTAVVLLIVLAISFLAYLNPFSESTSLTEPVASGTFVDSITVNGTLQPRSQEAVVTSLPGSISNIWVAEGDMVEEGDPLFEVETTWDHEDVAAPISGQVAHLDLITGKSYAEQSSASSPALVIADLVSMEVVLDINEVDIAKITLGQRAELSFDALADLSLGATVSHIATLPNTGSAAAGLAVGGTVVTYPVKLTLDEDNPALKPGMSVSALITVNEIPDVLLVNALALQELEDSTVVYVWEDNGDIAAVEVNVIASSPTQAAVEGELYEGEQVLIPVGGAEQQDYGDLFTVRRIFNG
jgi:HlyD family secretion protein